MKVLIVEDSKINQKILQNAVEVSGNEALFADDGLQGIKIFTEANPDIVITDIVMPNMNGLQLLKAIRRRSKSCIVIVVTADDKEENALEALQNGANNYIPKPININELSYLLHYYAGVIESRKNIYSIVGMIENIEYTIKFNNDFKMIPKYVEFITRETPKILNEEQITNATVGLIELMINAAEHGNLGISYEEKTKTLEKGGLALFELYNQKLQDPVIRNKRITVNFKMNSEYCEWIIKDEGNGFDYEKYLNQNNQNSLQLHGRGIKLSKVFFNELEYSENGTKVRVRMYKSNTHKKEENIEIQ